MSLVLSFLLFVRRRWDELMMTWPFGLRNCTILNFMPKHIYRKSCRGLSSLDIKRLASTIKFWVFRKILYCFLIF